MKAIAPLVTLALVLALLPAAAPARVPEKQTRPPEPAPRILVRYRADASLETVRGSLGYLSVDLDRSPALRARRLAVIDAAPRDHERLLRELRANPLVEYAEPDHRRYPHLVPNDAQYGQQWVMQALAMEAAWDETEGDHAVRIGIIDDGVRSSHEDFQGNIVPGKCFGSLEFCSAGFDSGEPRTANDDHGTAVAGQAGAAGNAVGITGTARKVTIVSLRTDLTVSNIVAAIDWAKANNIHILNASYGGASFSRTEYDAVANSGILFVTSAGNSHTDNDKGKLSFPQAFDLDNVLTVAASDQSDRLTSWAQYGQTSVDVVAGGLGILTTSRTGINTYTTVSGSSFSAPLVAGIAALVRSLDPAAGFQEMKARIVAGAEMNDTLRGRVVAGRANAHKALTHNGTDAVLVVSGITVDDVFTMNGNDNAVLDAGETANLQVGVQNLWNAASNIQATLSLVNPADADLVTIEPPGMANLGNISPTAPGNHGTFAFPVTVAAGLTGNHRALFKLELNWDGGQSVTRYFEYELGLLAPGTNHQLTIGRSPQEHYHAFHVDVPAGASDLRIDTGTHGEYDIDLLARYKVPPKYQITLNEGPDSANAIFAYFPRDPADDPDNPYVVEVSGRFDGDESLVYATPDPGTYHMVVVNYGLQIQPYELSASWCTVDGCNCTGTACAGRIRFQQATQSGATGDQITVTVLRERGGAGAASVQYQTVTSPSDLDNAAVAGTDYSFTFGTLSWADGDTASKTFAVPLLTSRTAGRQILVRLFAPTGGTLGAVRHTVLTVPAPPAPPPPPPRSGGGGALPVAAIAVLLLLALWRRRTFARA